MISPVKKILIYNFNIHELVIKFFSLKLKIFSFDKLHLLIIIETRISFDIFIILFRYKKYLTKEVSGICAIKMHILNYVMKIER